MMTITLDDKMASRSPEARARIEAHLEELKREHAIALTLPPVDDKAAYQSAMAHMQKLKSAKPGSDAALELRVLKGLIELYEEKQRQGR